jgi:hypothetical protein
MMATCPHCGKTLKVKDEWAGKMLKCPGCRSNFKAEAGGGGGGHSPKVATASAAAGGPKKSTVPVRGHVAPRSAGIAVNMNVVLLFAGVGLIVLLVLAVVFGPVRVKNHWASHHDAVDEAVTDVLDQAMKAQASQDGSWNPRKSRGVPTLGDVAYLPDIFRLSIPETCEFRGFCSMGRFEGTYNFESGEVVLDLKLGGMMLPSGVFVDESGTSIAGGPTDAKAGTAAAKAGAVAGRKRAATGGTIHVTGRKKGGAVTAEIDGRKAEIYYPPVTDEDGNVE